MLVFSRLIVAVIRSICDPSAFWLSFQSGSGVSLLVSGSDHERRRDASATLSSREIGFQASRQLRHYAFDDLEWRRRWEKLQRIMVSVVLDNLVHGEPVERILKNYLTRKSGDIPHGLKKSEGNWLCIGKASLWR